MPCSVCSCVLLSERGLGREKGSGGKFVMFITCYSEFAVIVLLLFFKVK